MVKHQSTHWCSKSSTADHYQGDIDIAQEVVRARAISISVILQQKQLVDLRVVKTARAGLPLEFLAIATLALSPVPSTFLESKKRVGRGYCYSWCDGDDANCSPVSLSGAAHTSKPNSLSNLGPAFHS